jgi:ATP-dependent protease HslVU (ClpYQ) peptidase subunit
MTVIVAVKENGKVHIGADSAGVGVGDLSISSRKDEKVFVRDGFIVGFTSSFRMGQILKYYLNCPKQKKNQSDEEFMCTTFVDHVQELFKSKSFGKIESNEQTGGTFIVGYKGEIYTIDDDFQVGISYENYASVGCGNKLALGSLFTTDAYKMSVKDKLMAALSAAEKFSAGVCSPFIIKSL